MREAGADMMTKYEDTARGGLAVNIVDGLTAAGGPPWRVGAELTGNENVNIYPSIFLTT